ncbi:MAG: isochorismate synthase [Propioniciclava sp.]|uniref:isochorismate synthase n=1 Tax=Propioniciclava sp. TaxID=2038686 RepID=UPI0039E4E2BA
MTELLEDALAPIVDAELVFFTGEENIVAEHVLDTWMAPSSGQWADAVVASLHADQRAVGVLPFAPDGVAVMHRIVGSGHFATPAARGVQHRHAVTERPTAGEYARGVSDALARIARGEIDKVVLGRCLDVVSEPPLRAEELVARLLRTRPGRYIFSVPLSDDLISGPVLVGGSPELLVRRRGAAVSSLPLAGSVPRSEDPAEDARRAEALLDSSKDLDEHAYVVDEIVAALRPVARELRADARPRLLGTDTLWHLASSVEARIDPGSGPSALHLAQLLHPTPAVGGVPTRAALDVIAEIEGPDLRGPLAGAVGWVDGSGDGEFAVAIRSGVLHGARLRLFAGAGIVAGSEPDAEVRETGAKLATMARAVGL